MPECGRVCLKFRVALGMRHQNADAPHAVGLLRILAVSGHVAAAPPTNVMNCTIISLPPPRLRTGHRINPGSTPKGVELETG